MNKFNLMRYRNDKKREMTVFKNWVFWVLVFIIVGSISVTAILGFEFMMLPIGQWPAWAFFLMMIII